MTNSESPLRPLVLASSNSGKIQEFKNLLSSMPLNLLLQPEGFYVEENGDTFSENAQKKAIAVANETGEWALADDSGLCVKALNGGPGVYSARYASNDQERIARMLNELEGVIYREAFFSTALCIASEEGEVLLEVEGVTHGEITVKPKGNSGFGYDPIFRVKSAGLTYAEMSLLQKSIYGHRGRAFMQLKPKLKRLLSG